MVLLLRWRNTLGLVRNVETKGQADLIQVTNTAQEKAGRFAAKCYEHNLPVLGATWNVIAKGLKDALVLQIQELVNRGTVEHERFTKNVNPPGMAVPDVPRGAPERSKRGRPRKVH